MTSRNWTHLPLGQRGRKNTIVGMSRKTFSLPLQCSRDEIIVLLAILSLLKFPRNPLGTDPITPRGVPLYHDVLDEVKQMMVAHHCGGGVNADIAPDNDSFYTSSLRRLEAMQLVAFVPEGCCGRGAGVVLGADVYAEPLKEALKKVVEERIKAEQQERAEQEAKERESWTTAKAESDWMIMKLMAI